MSSKYAFRTLFAAFKPNLCHNYAKQHRIALSKRYCTTKQDVEALFLRPDVQQLLKDITGFNLEKIFSQKPVKSLNSPRYLFLTDEDLRSSIARAKKKAAERLVMPPVLNPRDDEPQILDVDTAIQGNEFSENNINIVFTDITLGFSDRERLIVVREPNGVLRRANRDERYRMNQTFFPVEGRLLETPKMFQNDNLEKVLDRFDYVFLLERACLQFEPDDPLYIDITHKTYEHIAISKQFDLLRSTRHFGPMAFYYAYNNKIDGLLIDMIDRCLISDGKKLVQLFYILQGKESATSDEVDELSFIKSYVVNHSIRRHFLEVSLRNYEIHLEEQKSLEEAVEIADGRNS